MKPEDRRARCITTHEGRYINIEDVKAALKDDDFVKDCAAMMAVAYQIGDDPIEGVRRAIGHAIWRLVGDEAREKKRQDA